MKEETGYYQKIDEVWIHAPNGIILPNTSEPTLDKKVMEENGWVWMDSKPIEEDEQR